MASESSGSLHSGEFRINDGEQGPLDVPGLVYAAERVWSAVATGSVAGDYQTGIDGEEAVIRRHIPTSGGHNEMRLFINGRGVWYVQETLWRPPSGGSDLTVTRVYSLNSDEPTTNVVSQEDPSGHRVVEPEAWFAEPVSERTAAELLGQFREFLGESPSSHNTPRRNWLGWLFRR